MDQELSEIIQEVMSEADPEEPETLPPVEVVDTELTPEQIVQRMQAAAGQIAAQLAQISQTGERLVMLLVSPQYHAAFESAFRALPEAQIPAEFRDKMPIMADEACQGVRIITQSDLSNEFLLRYYGPTDQGGNGLIAALEEAVARRPHCPVRLDLKTLEVMFFLELKEQVKPGILIPTGASLSQGMINPQGMPHSRRR